MNRPWHALATRTVNLAQWTLTLAQLVSIAAALAALSGCAGTASRPGAAAPPSASATAAPASAGARAGDSAQGSRRFQHAEALYLGGHFREAEADFEQLSRSYPNDARVWLKYGNTLTRLGSYDNAAAAFQNAVSLDPAQGGASLNLALVRLAQAQGSLETARGRYGADSPERAQAEALERQIRALLGPLGHDTPAR